MFLNHNDGSSDLISIGNYVYNPKFTIGQGSFGKVYIAENQKNGNKVAIKKLDLKFFEMNPYFTE